MKTVCVALLMLLAFLPASAADTRENPIRRVVTLLQNMHKSVEEEGEKEEELYKKFMCYCKGNTGKLTGEIKAAQNKLSMLESQIEEETASKSRLQSEVEQLNKEIAANQQTLSEATAIREREAKQFQDESTESHDNIDALKKAIPMIEKGMSGSLLQQHVASLKHSVTMARSFLSSAEHKLITNFLQASGPGDYSASSGQIVGILKNMLDEFDSDLKDSVNHESVARKDFESLRNAKNDEIAAAQKQVEEKTSRAGQLAESIAAAKEDHEDTRNALSDDQKFLMDMDNSCKTKTSEWETRSKTRNQELAAISQAIAILNDDDSLDLFKKTLKSPGQESFVQTTEKHNVFDEVRGVLSRSAQPRVRALAMSMMSVFAGHNFHKVLKMIDDMVDVLDKEQADDDKHRDWCTEEFHQSSRKKENTEASIKSHALSIDETKDSIATLASEVSALQAEIKDLDQSVVEATKQRKQENQEFQQAAHELSVAKELLAKAADKLNGFYNPKLVRKESSLLATAPPPPPETWGAYQNKSQENSGVLALMTQLSQELEQEHQEATHDEEEAQKDFAEFTSNAQAKRQQDSTSITNKEAEKGSLEEQLANLQDEHKGASETLAATNDYIRTLHTSCDFVVQHYDARKTARAEERQNLKKASSILQGAKFSLVQTNLRRH